MAEFFLELVSEEIPARMQRFAAETLARLLEEELRPLAFVSKKTYFGPRRIAVQGEADVQTPPAKQVERGPRTSAPDAALAGFLRKHAAQLNDLNQRNGYWVLEREVAGRDARALLAQALPEILWRFPWPKSMRWGHGSDFLWIRPLRRVLCLFNGQTVSFSLARDADNGHLLAASNVSEGHRFLAPGAFTVSSADHWRERLNERFVIADAEERRAKILRGLNELAERENLVLIADDALVDEVAGLVEWPVVFSGKIDGRFMDLPPEVSRVTMRVNQRYFTFITHSGEPAPHFAFVANIETPDNGKAIIAGNERVLRARLADARHFWDLDQRVQLEDRVPALERVVFHAQLGSQLARAERLENLISHRALPLTGLDVDLARRAARLAKADLTTGMVGEFPELQGIIGRYYALHDGENQKVADAIRDHYAPRGPTDSIPDEVIAASLALVDRIDQITGFFSIGERPTGSGDPYALRRAALGVIRILREKSWRLSLRTICRESIDLQRLSTGLDVDPAALVEDVLVFIVERLRVQLRSEGARHDVLASVFAVPNREGLSDDDLVRLLARAKALASFLETPDGGNLLTAYNRAASILRIEERKDGPFAESAKPSLFAQSEEQELYDIFLAIKENLIRDLGQEDFISAMKLLAALRPKVDAFFDHVTVNADVPELRRNRLRLLSMLRDLMDRVADFSRIEA